MAETLYLDIGNSASKWRLVDDQIRRQGSCRHQDSWSTILQQIPTVQPQQVHVASVAGKQVEQQLQAAVQQAWQLSPQFYHSPKTALGVINAYQQPQRLGVDRWLGMLEAYNVFGASIIIDCGSAITLDAVAADGLHLGGYIVPGLRLLRQSLLHGTADVRPDEIPLQQVELGNSTATAVANGVLRMVTDFIETRVVALQQRLADTCTCVATGGDLIHILPHLTLPTRRVDGLVLDGLERVVRNK